MSGMHSGNWGNGSGYDANMGENMNLEEIGSVLRWHEVNGTFPARTIKATLYDNEEGGLVGSGDYSAAGTAATLARGTRSGRRHDDQGPVGRRTSAPARRSRSTRSTRRTARRLVGERRRRHDARRALRGRCDTVIYVASVTGISAGHDLDLDLGLVGSRRTSSSASQTVGTAQRTATTLAAAAAAGDTIIKVASVATWSPARRSRSTPELNVEYRTITAVGTAGAAGTGVTLTGAARRPRTPAALRRRTWAAGSR